jgi:hypothetical protein
MAQRQAAHAANEFLGMQPLGQQARAGGQSAQQIALSFFRINPADLQKVTGGMKPLPPNATQQQREAAALALYQRLTVGGPGGLAYNGAEGRLPRSPQEVLRHGGGDCDEIAMLYIAAARALNIDTAGMSLAYITMPTMKPGDSRSERHAALFVRGMNGKNYIFDFTMGDKPWQVRDFQPAAVSKQYAGQRISQGSRAGQTVISATVRFELAGLRDIASFGLIDRAESIASGLPKGAVPAASFNSIMGALGSASIAASVDILRFKIASLYRILAERALSSGQRTMAASAGARGAAEFSLLPPATRSAQRPLGYALGLVVARAYEGGSAADRTAALRRYGDLARLDPAREDAYEGIYRLRVARLKAFHKAGRRADAQAEIDALARALGQGIKAAGTEMVVRLSLQSMLDNIVKAARAGRYRVPGPTQ